MDFMQEVIGWYQENKRDLPWRNTTDPYIIWLSEIILQQTRVEQGRPYFHRFAETFPTVADFAAASEDEILHLWQGLGYYSRGRNMHKTAQMVMEEHAGYFPKKYQELIQLKGIGEYTAAAISSFSSNEARAVVDGNVFRLLSRYFGIYTPINTLKGKKEFTALANQLIDANLAGLSNQAMMEFGSLQCRPKHPDCGVCPLMISCNAYRDKTVHELPVKIKSAKSRNRYFNYIIAIKEDKILLNKRGKNDIWENLHDFPMIETTEETNPSLLLKRYDFQSFFGTEAATEKIFGPVKHALSHQRIFANFIFIKDFDELFKENQPWFYVPIDELTRYAQPKLILEFTGKFLN